MKAYGLDFGTTNSLVAGVGNSKLQVIPVETDGTSILRSTVYVHPEKGNLVGNDAIDAYLDDVKRGEPLQLVRKKTGRLIKTSRYTAGGYAGEEYIPETVEVEKGNRGRLLQGLKSLLANKFFTSTEIFGKEYKLNDLLEIVLGELKERSDRIVGVEVKSVVLGRPVKFVSNDEDLAVRRMTSVAKRIGFTSIEFEYEPIAAALAHGLDENNNYKILVFDFGGGTLDVSITETKSSKILAVDGVPIGGDLLNSRIFNRKLWKYFGGKALLGEYKLEMPGHISNALQNWYSMSLLKTKSFLEGLETIKYLSDDKKAIAALHDLIVYNLGFALYEEIDKGKIELSNSISSEIVLSNKSININEHIERTEFEEMIRDYLRMIEDCLDRVLEKAGTKEPGIDYVLTTGGSSLIPAVNKLLIERFGRKKLKEIDVFESVVKGLAIKAEKVFG